MKQKALITISGGINSVTALYQSVDRYDVELGVSFNYGSKHNHKEIPFAKYHCVRLGVRHIVVNLDFINDYFNSTILRSGGIIPDGDYTTEVIKQTAVPFLNGTMLSVAAGIAESLEINKIIIATNFNQNMYLDSQSEFIKSMSSAVSLGTSNNVDIFAPFQNMSKADVVNLGNALNVDFSKTWSCFRGKEKHCEKCGPCILRKKAFSKAGISDPTQYEPNE